MMILSNHKNLDLFHQGRCQINKPSRIVKSSFSVKYDENLYSSHESFDVIFLLILLVEKKYSKIMIYCEEEGVYFLYLPSRLQCPF